MKIKKRESLRTIKTFDRAENLAQKTRNGVSSLNRSSEQTQGVGDASETDYAEKRISGAEHKGIRTAAYEAEKYGHWSIRTTQKNLKQHILSKKKKIPKSRRLNAQKRKAAKVTAKTVKQMVRATIQAIKVSVKALVGGTKLLIAATGAIGVIAVLIIILLFVCALIIGYYIG